MKRALRRAMDRVPEAPWRPGRSAARAPRMLPLQGHTCAAMIAMVRRTAREGDALQASPLSEPEALALLKAIEIQRLRLPTTAVVVRQMPTEPRALGESLERLFARVVRRPIAEQDVRDAAKGYMTALHGFQSPGAWTPAAAGAAQRLLTLAGIPERRIHVEVLPNGLVALNVVPTRAGVDLNPWWAQTLAMGLLVQRVRALIAMTDRVGDTHRPQLAGGDSPRDS